MFAYDQCREYLRCLNKRDLDAILRLFTEHAEVSAPLSGNVTARDFHHNLFQRSNRSVARLVNVFSSVGRTDATALQFHYTWVFPVGRVVELDGLSIFEFARESSLIQHLKIVYDPTELRASMAKCEHRQRPCIA